MYHAITMLCPRESWMRVCLRVVDTNVKCKSAVGETKFCFGEAGLLRNGTAFVLSPSLSYLSRAMFTSCVPMTVGAARILERMHTSHRGVIYTILFDDLYGHCIRLAYCMRFVSINGNRCKFMIYFCQSRRVF